MSVATTNLSPAGIASPRRAPVVPNGVLGMLIFAAAESMFFAGIISAFTIVRAGTPPGMWPPPWQPRLPGMETAVNTAALIASGLVLFFAHRRYRRAPSAAAWPLLLSWVLGATFVVLQGAEWVELLRQGMTLRSSQIGAFFYLIVGAHASHALVALAVLGAAWLRLRRGKLESGFFFAAQCLWYFVVALWPIIYARVYF